MDTETGGNRGHRHRDLLHTAVLFGAVPLLFFSVIWLVRQTAPVASKPLPSIEVAIQRNVATMTDLFPISTSPAPSKKWLHELDDIEKRVDTATNLAPGQLESIKQRLSLLRKHIEKFSRSVPEFISDKSDLGAALQRIRVEIQSASSKPSKQQAPLDWQTEFTRQRNEFTSDRQRELATAAQEQLRPIQKLHQTDLVALTRQSRELEDQIEAVKDREATSRRDHTLRVDRLNRLRAFQKDRAEIDRLLSPFITPGYTQIGAHSGDQQKTAEKHPLSYKDLDRFNALNSDIEGLRELFTIGGYTASSPALHRPLRSFPTYSGGELSDPRVIETLKRAQELLKLHRKTLIEESLMLP